jgi:putative transposase
VKYRKKLLTYLGEDIKQILFDISLNSDFSIDIMEIDKDHIHILIDFKPVVSILAIVNRLKSVSTKKIWSLHNDYLKKNFWDEHTFWSDGYFACSTGEASTETIRKYILEQG